MLFSARKQIGPTEMHRRRKRAKGQALNDRYAGSVRQHPDCMIISKRHPSPFRVMLSLPINTTAGSIVRAGWPFASSLQPPTNDPQDVTPIHSTTSAPIRRGHRIRRSGTATVLFGRRRDAKERNAVETGVSQIDALSEGRGTGPPNPPPFRYGESRS